MKLNHNFHAVANRLADFLKRLYGFAHLLRGYVKAAVLYGSNIKRPDLHSGDAAVEQAFRQPVCAVHKGIEILERTARITEIPVGHGSNILGANVTIACTGVVDPEFVAAQTTQHLMNGLIADFPEQIPQRNVDR